MITLTFTITFNSNLSWEDIITIDGVASNREEALQIILAENAYLNSWNFKFLN